MSNWKFQLTLWLGTSIILTLCLAFFELGKKVGKQEYREANYICAGFCSDGSGVWWPARPDGSCFLVDKTKR